MKWQFGDLKTFGYDLIMVDPPWTFENWSEAGEGKNPKAHYDCMTLDEIKALRVGELASKDCVLLLWVTNPLLQEGLEVMRHWCFRYVGLITWIKKTVNDKHAFGTGYRVRCSTEHMALGIVGNPETSKGHRSSFEGLVRGHSEKPEEAYHWAETYLTTPTIPARCELFSRRDRAGWDVWGNEVGKLNDKQEAGNQAA